MRCYNNKRKYKGNALKLSFKEFETKPWKKQMRKEVLGKSKREKRTIGNN